MVRSRCVQVSSLLPLGCIGVVSQHIRQVAIRLPAAPHSTWMWQHFPIFFLKKSYYTPVPALFTCYKELSTNGHTSQAISGGGEVSSRGPCSGASGPGLGGGDGGVIEACLSTIFNNRLPAAYDKHLHSVCYKILWLDMTDILQCIIVIAA